MKKLLAIFTIIMGAISLSATWVEIDNDVKSSLFDHSASSRSNTTIGFSLSGYDLEKVIENGEEFSKVSFLDEGRFIAEGKPNLPRFTRLIAIPNTGEVSFQITSIDEQVLSDIKVYPSQILGTESEPYRGEFVIDNEFYNGSSVFPQPKIEIGEPAILRDYRIVPVTVNAFQYNPLKEELVIINNIEIEVEVTGNRGLNIKKSSKKKSRAFESLYQSSILNYESFVMRDEEYQQPSYLFIHPNNTSVASALEYLTEWKRQKGFEVNTASTSQTGSSNSSIKNYIQNAYNTWENPPEFVVLVGDVNGSVSIPTFYETWSGYGGEGDHTYSKLEGNDVLADVIMGRLSCGSVTDLQTIISKVLKYEKEPYMGNTNWYNQALLVGDPSSSGTSTIYTNQSIGQMITEHSDINLTEVYSGGYSSAMTNNINSGVSYFNYRGYIGMSGFGNSQINSLSNGPMLPLAIFLTCSTGGFASGESRSEAFIRAGSASVPKGAIAAIGTATSGTHTNFNNCIDAGIYYGIFADKIYNPGGAINRGKLALYMHYPQNPGNYVDIFSHWNTLMGDPGVELWTGIPQQLVVDYESQISPGTDYLEIIVEDENGNPLLDTWVTALMDDDGIFATGYTDENGYLALEINAEVEGTVRLTATKHDFIPHLGGFTVSETDIFVNTVEIVIDDDNSGGSSGNNDGIVNPGEEIELSVSLQNFGTQTANAVSAEISSDNEFIEITDNTESYGNISSGNAVFCADNFNFSVAENTLDGTKLKIDITISDNAGNEWTDIIFIPVQGANLDVIEYTIEDVNGILEPGETAAVSITLQNNGSVIANAISGELISTDSRITVIDANGYFGNISGGGQASNTGNTFEIQASAQIVMGTQFMMEVNLTNTDGFEQTVHFILGVGEVSINDPVGPDAYGYYFYDDEDVNYYNVPVYDWIEINSIGTNLNLSDNGDTGDIETINLPITFRMYGEEYSTVTICSNGWIAPGGTTQKSFMNSPIPGPQGPSPMIAPFWDDLQTGSGEVYWYYDSAQHYVIIEWDNVRNDQNNHEQTFQAILYDANYYITFTGDSEMKFQYKEVNNTSAGSYPSQHGQYASVGIEDHTGLVGLEYTFNNTYPDAAKVLEDEMAILITGPAISLVEPFLVLGCVNINDTNGNNQADYGEEVALDIILNNLGENSATGVSATIATVDEFITINQPNSDYSDVLGGGSSGNLTDFVVTIAQDCPDEHIVAFEINITSNENSWLLYFTLELNAPLINFETLFINDGANGVLDPGENADILLSFHNEGGSDAFNVNADIEITNEYITLNTSTFDFGTFNSNSIITATYNVDVADDAPTGYQIDINWLISGDLDYSNSGVVLTSISQVPVQLEEHFNSFPPTGWSVTSSSGQINWEGSSTNGAGGSAPEAKFYWTPSTTAIQRLKSPVLNTLGSSSLELEFKHLINDYSGDYDLRLETTSDGTNWNIVQEWPSQTINSTTENITISTSDVGSSTFQFAFTFDGNSYNINWWYIDDVYLENNIPEMLGYVSGNVILNGGAGNIEEVNISAGDTIMHPDENGDYTLPLFSGIYDITASLDGYESITETDVEIIGFQTTTLDFTLSFLVAPHNLVAESLINNVTLEWEMPDRNTKNFTKHSILSVKNNTLNKQVNKKTRLNRDRAGFKIYRNSAEIAEINNANTMTYLDENLDSGDYSYYVTAFYYDDSESLSSNTVAITVILDPPTDLIAYTVDENIKLEWNAPEFTRNLTGYKVYRDNQNIAETEDTEYIDTEVVTASYTYYVTAMYGSYESASSNEFTIEHTDAEEFLIPKITLLNSNFPNPFNPETTLSFSLAKSGKVKLLIYNLKGQLIKKLLDKELPAGYHNIVWNGKDNNSKQVSSGMYLYKMKSENYDKTKRMIMLK
ncbi:MAG: T9SS type A sorting domain-containing protein [Candidatus Cloacimonetes bacterium]|nr:T9SS type A sorting domain-containing protein [Candidatus Cloacimonadota bacterium]